jgi:hypothetical protein
VNRHERRTAAALARRDRRARESVLEAIRAALPPDVRAELDAHVATETSFGETLLGVADCVVQGLCTVAEAAEAITYTNELADATVRGDITTALGCELVERLKARQMGDIAAD